MNPIVYIVRNDQPIDIDTFQYLMRFVPQKKKKRIMRQRIKQNADNMLVGTILARYMILKFFKIPLSAQHISYGLHGKPYLRDYPNAQFNISHSGQFVACAVYDRPIGLDIQKIVPYHRDVAKRIFKPNDIVHIESSPDPDFEFTKLWAQKEAYLKMLGIGLSNI